MRTTIVILVMTLCLFGWWTMSADVVPPPPPPVDTETTANVEEAVAPTTANGPVEASNNRERAGTSADVVASEAPELPDDAEWIEVTLVHRETGEPVVGANVMWTNQLQSNGISELPMHERQKYYDGEVLAKRFGWRTRSDEQGLIRVVPGKQRATVYAEKDGLYGVGYFGNEPPPRIGHRIEMEPDLTLRVKVFAANGEPASDVPMATINHDPKQPIPKQQYWWGSRPVMTDEHGIAAFPHMQTRQRTGARKAEKPILQWLVYVRSAGLKVEPLRVDAQAPPSEPIEIHLPATGHLQVRVLTGGEPWPKRTVRIWESPKKGDSRQSWMLMNQAIQSVTDDDGWFEYRHVGLNKMYSVSFNNVTAEVAGPTVAEETAERILNLDEHAIVLAGKALRPDGTGLAIENLKVGIREGDRNRGETWVMTEKDGSFVALWSPKKDGKPFDRTTISVRWEPNDEQALFAELAPRVLQVGRVELGDVQMRGAHLIVSGAIVPTTKLEHKCNVQIERMRPPRREGSKPSWRSIYNIDVQVDDDHNFIAYGTVEPGRYRLRIYNQEVVRPDPVEFAIGAENLRIPVTTGNELAVHVLLPVPLTGNGLKVRLKKVGEDGEGRRPQHRSRGEGEADFTWKGLADGVYEVDIRPKGWGRTAPYHRIGGIRLPLDGSRVGVLADVDLRGKLTQLELNVTFEDKKNGVGVAFLMPQEQEIWQGVHVRQGKAVLTVPVGATEWLIGASRFEPITLQGVQGSADVAFKSRAETHVSVVGLESVSDEVTARITAAPLVKPVEDKRRYRAEWGSDMMSELLRGTSTRGTVRDGKAKFVLGEGSHKITLRLRHKKTRRSKTLKLLNPNEIAAGSSYQVMVDPAELAKAITEISQPRKQKN